MKTFLTLNGCLIALALVGAQRPLGTGTITGVVVTDDARATPVRRAIVTVAGVEVSPSRSAITDDAGRFAFGNLPAGRFTITATKPAYLVSAYGAKRPGRAGTPLTLAAGQTASGIIVRIARGSAISGTVRDQNGEPASGIPVAAVRPELVTSGVGASPQTVTTDDRGMYRMFGLPPGEYLVAAMMRGGNEIAMMSASEVDAALSDLELRRGGQSAAGGRSTGRGNAAASQNGTKVPLYGYAPTFYPGTPIAADAERVVLAVGDERNGVDFTASPMPTATIEGTVSNADGAMPAVALVINPAGAALPLSITASMGYAPYLATRPGPGTNTFKYINVAPGTYTIIARSSSVALPTSTRFSSSSGPAQVDTSGTPVVWAMAEVTVNGRDVSGLGLSLQPAMKFSGRVAFDATTLTPPVDLTSMRVGLTSTVSVISYSVGGTNMGATPVPRVAVRPDGTFVAGGILPGSYRVTADLPAGTGWWLRSAIVRSRDVLDGPLVFGASGDLSDAVITYSDRHNELSGALQTASGQAAPGYTVTVFSADRALWLPGSRRTRSTRPASDGKFVFRDLPAGEYLIAALVDVEPADLNDPKFLEQLVGAAITIVIADGERKVQDIRIAGGV